MRVKTIDVYAKEWFDKVMRKTEKKHWYNGYTIHGGWFKQYAFSLLSFGCILHFGMNRKNGVKVGFKTFWLV